MIVKMFTYRKTYAFLSTSSVKYRIIFHKETFNINYRNLTSVFFYCLQYKFKFSEFRSTFYSLEHA